MVPVLAFVLLWVVAVVIVGCLCVGRIARGLAAGLDVVVRLILRLFGNGDVLQRERNPNNWILLNSIRYFSFTFLRRMGITVGDSASALASASTSYQKQKNASHNTRTFIKFAFDLPSCGYSWWTCRTCLFVGRVSFRDTFSSARRQRRDVVCLPGHLLVF